MAIITEKYQGLMDAVWRELIAASDAYFLRHEAQWAGDSRAPEFGDEQVERQVAAWDAYRTDPGALNWGGDNNSSRPFAHDFTRLPLPWKRAVCERAWVLCQEAGLWDDEEYMASARMRRESQPRAA